MEETYTLNIETFLENVLATLGEPDNLELKQLMQSELDERIKKAVGMNLSPSIIDYVAKRYPNETDENFMLSELINNSPQIQNAILNTLDEFKQEMVSTLQAA